MPETKARRLPFPSVPLEPSLSLMTLGHVPPVDVTHPDLDHVVLLHGVISTPWAMLPLARQLARSGLRPHCWTYPWRTQAIPGVLAYLAERLEQIRSESCGRIHFVGHSMGGLVIRALLASPARPGNLGRVVMKGTPQAGSEWADLLHQSWLGRATLGAAIPLLSRNRAPELEAHLGAVDYELGLIAGDRPSFAALERRVIREASDGEVAVSSTYLPGARDHIILPLGHTQMLYSRSVHIQVTSFLKTGCFVPDPHVRRGAAPDSPMRAKRRARVG